MLKRMKARKAYQIKEQRKKDTVLKGDPDNQVTTLPAGGKRLACWLSLGKKDALSPFFLSLTPAPLSKLVGGNCT